MRRDWHAAIQVDLTLKGHAVAPGDRRFCGRMYCPDATAVRRIQVDEFERACMQLGIELLVLPARKARVPNVIDPVDTRASMTTEVGNLGLPCDRLRCLDEQREQEMRSHSLRLCH